MKKWSTEDRRKLRESAKVEPEGKTRWREIFRVPTGSRT